MEENKDTKAEDSLWYKVSSVIIGFTIAIAVLISTFQYGKLAGVDEVRKEAVKNHCGKWVSDEDGSPCFKWVKVIEIEIQKGKICSKSINSRF